MASPTAAPVFGMISCAVSSGVRNLAIGPLSEPSGFHQSATRDPLRRPFWPALPACRRTNAIASTPRGILMRAHRLARERRKVESAKIALRSLITSGLRRSGLSEP